MWTGPSSPLVPHCAEPAPAWVPVTTADEVTALSDGAPAVAVLEAAGEEPLPVTSRVLEATQAWLNGAGLEESRLVVVTRGAVPAGAGPVTNAVTDPAGAAVWGLVRAAQSENPDRVVLLDLDPAADVRPFWGRYWPAGEPQLAVRGTSFLVPRLARVPGETAEGPVFRPEGTVLVSGAGTLGALAARQLVARHGVRHLLLASRRGRDAEGVAELVAELTGHGAEVTVVACDVSDRDQVAALLADHPITGGRAHGRGVRRRRDRRADLRAAGEGVRAEGGRGAAPRRADPRHGPRRVHRLLVRVVDLHGRGQRRLRRGERVPRRVHGAPQGGGPAGVVPGVGAVARDHRHGRHHRRPHQIADEPS